jgi:hypothetical protein
MAGAAKELETCPFKQGKKTTRQQAKHVKHNLLVNNE